MKTYGHIDRMDLDTGAVADVTTSPIFIYKELNIYSGRLQLQRGTNHVENCSKTGQESRL